MFNSFLLPFLLIVLYTCLLLFYLYTLTRRDRQYLSARQLTASFILKIVSGMLYGYLFMRLYHGDDTWVYHQESLVEYRKLLHHPVLFIKDTFTQTGGNLSLEAVAGTTNSFWSDFEEVLFIRMLALFNVLSFGNYYVNVVLFCFVSYLGNLMLFRLLKGYFPRSSFLLYLTIFFYPMVLFWLSGIRKEGVLFTGLAAALYYFDKAVLRNKPSLKNLLLFTGSVFVVGLIRNQVVLCLAPALLAVFISRRFRIRQAFAFAAVYAAGIIFFFNSGLIPGFPNLAGKVAERQHSFMSLKGTRLPLDSLHASPGSFVRVFPQALNHTFIRPYITESASALQLVSALDVFLFFGFLLFVAIFHLPGYRKAFANPVLLICLFTAFAGYLLTGYIVPFPGAFVRYKSIFELLFAASLAVMGRWPPILYFTKKNISDPISK